MFISPSPIDIVEYLRFREDKFINMKTIKLNSDYALYKELANDARDFIRPYLEHTSAELNFNGDIVFTDKPMPMLYDPMMDVYESLRFFIMDITIRHGTLADRHQGRRLLKILNRSKNPRDYTIVLQIIFKMIRRGFLNKREVVDAVSKTENTAALVELLKFEDYSVFDERLQF